MAPGKYTILHGNCPGILEEIEAGSIQCVCCSPPFFGLRKYEGVEPIIWLGSTGDPDCDHEWGAPTEQPGSEYREGLSTSTFQGRTDKAEIRKALAKRPGRRDLARKYGPGNEKLDGHEYRATGALCVKCGAWLGLLGMEPLHDCGAWARKEPPCSSCFVCHLRTVFGSPGRGDGVWRVLRDDGVLLLNLSDSYTSGGSTYYAQANPGTKQATHDNITSTPRAPQPPDLKPKDLCGVPWRVALALQADGWWLRSDMIYSKTSPMPESVNDRPTRSHEYLFLLTKAKDYFWDKVAVEEEAGRAHSKGQKRRPPKEAAGVLAGIGHEGWCATTPEVLPTRNLRTVWTPKPERNDYDYCLGCESLYADADRKLVIKKTWDQMAAYLRERGGVETDEGVAEVLGCAREKAYKGMKVLRRWDVCPNCENWNRWVSHYAAFPKSLPRLAILAGTSAEGACPECGAPWRRIVKTELEPQCSTRTETLGWEPTCTCTTSADEDLGGTGCTNGPHVPVSCKVLDLFSGTGTTGVVAVQLGREYIGTDASLPYVRLSQERIRVLGSRHDGLRRVGSTARIKQKKPLTFFD